MSQPDFNKTLNSLYSAMTEIKHLRAELEAKKAIIAQLNSKIAVLESSKGNAPQQVQSASKALAYGSHPYCEVHQPKDESPTCRPKENPRGVEALHSGCGDKSKH